MADLKILLSGTTLDIYDNEPINLSYSVADIKDIKQRKSTFSKSFTLPGSPINDEYFKHIFEVSVDSRFNPAKNSTVSLTLDDIPFFDGNFQLTKVNVDKENNISYEATLFGENDNLIKSIGNDSMLTDLDCSDFNHAWNYQNIVDSWTAATGSYFYPLIDYGYDWQYSDLQAGVRVDQMLPATPAKYLWDKVFETAGFTYESSFLNSDMFKELYLPFVGDLSKVNDPEFSNQRSFRAQSTSGASFVVSTGYTGGGMPVQYFDLPFSDDSTNGNFDNGNLFSATNYSYSSDTNSVQKFNVVLEVSASTLASGHIGWGVEFYRFTGATYGSIPFHSQYFPTSQLNGLAGTVLFSTPYLDQPSNQYLKPLEPGEKVKVRVKMAYAYSFGSSFLSGQTLANIYSGNSYFYNEVKNTVIPGQTLSYSNLLPRQYKQVDFINDIITTFNLMVEPSKDNFRKLFIEPQPAYYASGRTHNWTKKLDSKIKITEDLLSEQQNKRIILSYKPDKDFYNEDYTNKMNRTYGDYIFEVDNDFVKDDKKISPSFSPTPMTNVSGSQQFIMPRIGKMNNGVFERTEINVRLLQKNVINLTNGENWKFVNSTFNYFPYIGHLKDPFDLSEDNFDLNFGQLEFSYYPMSSITSNNLFTQYYEPMLEEISDKDSKLITAFFHLTPVDINQFSFRDNVFVEGITPGSGYYFRVNKINYNPISSNPSKVELIKVKNQYVRPRRLTILPHNGNTNNTGFNLGADNSNNSPGAITFGKDIVIGFNSSGSMAGGYKNSIEGGSPNNAIVGGAYNTIRAGVTGSTILGGEGITVEESNRTYVSNLTVIENITLGSGVTFNFSGTTLDIWSSSTGSDSIIANNSTGNYVGTPYGVILGGVSNFIN